MLRVFALFLALSVPAGLLVQSSLAQTAKKPAAKRTVKKSTAKKKTATSKSSATKKTSPQRKASGRARSGKQSAAARPVRQTQPAKERLIEIQQALHDRGYLNQAPDGVWGPASEDALRRFQEDQNIKPTGKLNSLSLIALGLGPKRTQVVAAPEAPPDN